MEEYLNVVLPKFLSLDFETEGGKNCQQNLQVNALEQFEWKIWGFCIDTKQGASFTEKAICVYHRGNELCALSVPEVQWVLTRIAVLHLMSGLNSYWEHIFSPIAANLTDCKGRAITTSRKETELSKGHYAQKIFISFLRRHFYPIFWSAEVETCIGRKHMQKSWDQLFVQDCAAFIKVRCAICKPGMDQDSLN